MSSWLRTPQQIILFIVITGHLGGLLVSQMRQSNPLHFLPSEKITVRTKTVVPTQTVSPSIQRIPKSSAQQLATIKHPPPSSKRYSQGREKTRQLLHSLDASLANIDSNVKKLPKSAPLTNVEWSVEITDNRDTSTCTTYFSSVSSLFRNRLTLPEKGMVKVTISVQPNGKIVKLVPVIIQSELNFRYLEGKLLRMYLPPTPSAQTLLITVTFCEEKRRDL